MIRTCKYLLFITIIILISYLDLSAATVILKSGATIKGLLMDKTDEKIVIQETYTKEVRIIRADLILSITLDPSEQKIVEQKKSGRIFIKGNILEQIEPTLGLMPGIAYPIGKMGSRIQIGYGGNLFFDMAIPLVPGSFALRLGVTAGALYHGTSKTNASSSVLHFPVNAYAKFQFLTVSGVRPYIKIGGGTVPVLIGGKVDIPPAAIAAFGIGYSNAKIPFMEFFIEAGYMMVFEKIRGDFVTGNIGVAYRFGAPAAATSAPAGGK